MDLKVGDKVRIKSKEWFKNNILFSSVLSISDCYGKEATITKKIEYGYYINIGPKFMFWPETAFEPMSYWSVNMPKDSELKKTVTVNMPNDLDVSTVEYDGKITINIQHKEVEGPKFKNGDIIYSEIDDGYSYIAIYKDSGSDGSFIIYHVMLSCDNYITFYGVCGADIFRLATKEEKEKLFKELANQKQLRWNAEKLKFEPIRYRAEYGGKYWYIGDDGEIHESTDIRSYFDKSRYNFCNYFQTEELSKQALPELKEFFKKLKY